MKKLCLRKIRLDEKGTVLIMVLILMVVMSVIGVTASMMSNTEIKIAYNTKVSRMAFYAADAGIEVSPKIVSSLIDDPNEAIIPLNTDFAIDSNLVNEIMGYTTETAASDQVSPTISNPDLLQTMNDSTFAVDIDRDPTGAKHMVGGGVQFASGAEGIGSGSAGGVLIYYDFISRGTSLANAKSLIEARYRKVVGVAGGK